MSEKDFLATLFDSQRGRLQGIAYRMLGSMAEAEDAVQEAWFRLNGADSGDIGNLAGWLTTVLSRICLDHLRIRKVRAEESLEADEEGEIAAAGSIDPEQELALADSVGLAMLVVLDTLAPAERIAFVLHDMFDLSFEQIAPVVGRNEAAARQLASRARRRVRGVPKLPEGDLARQRIVVEAFLAAARGGDFNGLLAVLDPEIVLRADATAVALGGKAEMRGAEQVAASFKGRAQRARAVLIDGAIGVLVVAPSGKPLLALLPVIQNDRIAAIEIVGDADRLEKLEFSVLG